MKSFTKFSASVLFVLLPQVAAAESLAELLLADPDTPAASSYMSGVASALTMANAYIEINGSGPTMFCTPRDMELSGDLALEAMRYAYAKYDEEHPAMLVMIGMRDMFPCG